MHWRNQTFIHLTTHRNWQKQTTHRAFLTYLKTILKWSDATIWYIGMYTLDGTLFLWIHFHLVQNVYHEPGPPASGHLVFADLPNPDLFHICLSKIWRTNSVKALTYAENSFCFFRKQCSVTHSKSCAPCLGFKGLYQRMGSLPFYLNLSLFPPGPEASLDPVSSLVFFSC